MAYFYFLVNGTPFSYFQSFNDLRLVDPLSPDLCILAMEMLSKIPRGAKEGALIFVEVRYGNGGCSISFLLSILLSFVTLIRTNWST